MKRTFLVLILGLLVVASAAGYTRITSSTGNQVAWPSMPIQYFINQEGSSQILNDSEFVAVRSAFQTWADVPTANVRFNYLGTAVINSVGADGVNLVSFNDPTTPIGSGTLAVTLSFFGSSGVVSEADILMNPNQSWSTSGESGRYDMQSVLTHEIGHFLGLEHSGMVSSVMTPFGSPSQVDQRTLQYDDIAGISEIYPSGSPTVGRITGVVRNGASAVNGAHVVAVDAAGTALVSTIAAADGSFTIRFLPPGNYRVYAEPLDNPVAESNLGGFFRNMNLDFGTTYFPNASTLPAAQTVQVSAAPAPPPSVTIQVLPHSSTNLNVTRPAFGPRVGRGLAGTLTIGGVDLSSGVVVSSSSPTDVLLGTPTFNSSTSGTAPTTAAIPITITSSAALGPKNIAVNRGTDNAVGTGAIVVVDRVPSGVGVNPSSGPVEGQVRVTVTGTNFREGARVYFGGLPSSDVRFVSSTTLDVLTPANPPGSALVLVVNADGTAGVSTSGYVYEVPPPSISNVSPQSGPPTTMVTIDGTNFDPNASQVFFNGTASRVVTATSTRLVTAVPYGSTSGPLSLSSFGKTAVGPNFTVMAAAPSANNAAASYAFTDASAGAGGTNLTFSANDDSVAAVTLPFTFSLFRDIYPAGSQITVSTNGFLSLEAGAGAEFQNGPLPGQTVQKPAASGCFTFTAETRQLPRALIAPFFDDLVMIPAISTISTRLVGTAPNRKFIVQWSNLSVLDETGCDLHSIVTFQAVLYEGSNDVQFVYPSLVGPRSDGISATVGMQNSARNTGVQTSFNQSRFRTRYYVTYRFSDGTYAPFATDATVPTTPVVLDGGATTNSTSSLSASWTADDPESGIREYQYAIGTTPGGTDVAGFVTTTSNFAVVTNLSLGSGTRYYFSVRAVNNEGMASAVGVSDGILVDPTLVISSRIIPFVQHNATRYTGIALLAFSSMFATLTAVNDVGVPVSTTTVFLNPGQQYAKLVSELFDLDTFEGWLEVQASAPGLGIFSATGSRDNRDLDGAVPRELSADFIAMHPGSTLWLVNPADDPATATISGTGTSLVQSVTIPGRSRRSVVLSAVGRVISSLPLAAIEVIEGPGRLALSVPEPSANVTSTLTFPDAVIGGEYSSTLTLVNRGATGDATISFMGTSRTVTVQGSSSTVVALNSLFPIPSDIRPDAVRVTTTTSLFGAPSLMGSVDIANPQNLVSLGSRPVATEFSFPHVAHGGELFTGLCLVAGSGGATVTVDIYTPGGDIRRSASVTLAPNQQIAKLVSELVPAVTSQLGGYIRVRSDQPILAWEIYGSSEAFASGPPL